MLKIKHLSASYGARPVLHDIDLSVASGEVLALIGGQRRIDAQRLPGRFDHVFAHSGAVAGLVAIVLGAGLALLGMVKAARRG